MKYNRAVLKLSGEALGVVGTSAQAFSLPALESISTLIKEGMSDIARRSFTELIIVVGGGNILRGAENLFKGKVSRTAGDYAGMMATVINALILRDFLGHAEVVSDVEAPGLPTVKYSKSTVLNFLSEKKIVILAGGFNLPYFSTDTVAVQRALELEAGVVLKATKVGGIFDREPMRSDAKIISSMTYKEAMGTTAMDETALVLAKEHMLPIQFFHVADIRAVLLGSFKGTRIDYKGQS